MDIQEKVDNLQKKDFKVFCINENEVWATDPLGRLRCFYRKKLD